jgi:hypothetical protein
MSRATVLPLPLAATVSTLRCGEAVIEADRAEDVDTAPGKSPCNLGLAVADYQCR